jgi:hypothetical protein
LCASPPKWFLGFVQRLLPGEAEISEQVRIIGDCTQRLALPVPRPLPS